MANTAKKIVLNIDTQISNQKALQALLTDLQKLQANAGGYGVNLNTVNSALNKTQELLKIIKATTKTGYSTSITEIQELEKCYSSLAKSLNKLDIQIANNTTTNDDYTAKIKSISDALKKATEDLERFKKQQLALQTQVSKQDMEALVGGAIKTRKKSEKRNSDTKSDKFLRQVTSEGLDIFDPVVKQSVDPKVYEEAIKTLLEYTAQIEDELKAVNQQVTDTTTNVANLTDQLNKAKTTPVTDSTMTLALQENGTQAAEQAANYKQLTQEMKESGQAQIETTKATNQHTTSLGRATKAVINYHLIYRSILNIMRQALTTIKEMDDALTGMSVVTGQSREEIKKLIPQLRNLATETSSTMTDVANLTTEYVRQGRTIKDSLVLAEQTAKAAQVAGISTSDSLQYMTSAINGFNLAAGESSRVNDLFAKLGAATATDYENLAVALSKVSAQANTAGMSIEFTTSLLAKGIETTQEAPESIGTALKTILARMREISDYGTSLEDNTSINKVERALGAVGVSLRDTNGQFREMEDIFKELGPQWDSLTGMQQQSIAQAVAGTRQQSRFLAIMQDWDRTLEISEASQNALGESTYQYNQYAESMTASITRLTTAFQGFIQNLVETDLVIDIVNIVEGTLQKVNNIIDGINNFTGDLNINLTAVVATIILLGSVMKTISGEIAKSHHETYQAIIDATNGTQEHQAALAQVESKWMSLTDRVKKYNEECQTVNDFTKESKLLAKYDKNTVQAIKNEKEKHKNAKEELKLKQKTGKLTKKEYKEALAQEKKRHNEAKKTFKTKSKQAAESHKQTKAHNKKINKQLDESYKKEKELVLSAKQKGVYDEKQIQDAKELLKQQSDYKQKEEELAKVAQTLEEGSEERNKIEEQLNTVKNSQKATEEQINALDQTNVGIAQQQLTQETLKDAKIKEQNAGLMQQGLLLLKNLGKQITSTIVEIAKATATMVGIGAAMAAAGILASAVGGGITSLIKGWTGEKQREKITENQDKIYENKSDVSEVEQLIKEYQELLLKESKGILTAEDRDTMKDIENSLHEIDSSITGTGAALVKSVDNFISTTESENKKLIKQNYDHFLAVLMLTNKSKGENFEFLKGDEGKLAVASMIEQQGLENYNKEIAAQQLSMFNALDWDSVISSYKGKIVQFDSFITNFQEVTGAMLSNMDTLEEGDLAGRVQEYQKAMLSASEETKKALQRMYGNYDIYANNLDSINKLISTGTMTGTEIDRLTTSLVALEASAKGVGTVLSQLATKGFDATYSMLLNYTDEDWARLYYGEEYGKEGKTLKDYQKLNSERIGFESNIKELVIATETGYNLVDLDDTITTLTSSVENRAEIIEKLLNNESLEDSDYDILDNLGLTSDTSFMESLINDPINAAMILSDKAEEGKKTIEDNINETIKKYEDWIKKNEEDSLTADDATKERLQKQNETFQAEINVAKLRLANLEKEYDLYSEYEMQITKRTAIIEKLQKQLDEISEDSLDVIKTLVSTYASQAVAARNKIDTDFETMLKSYAVDSSLGTKFEDYYEIINGQAVIIENKYKEVLKKGSYAFAAALKTRAEEFQEQLDMVLEAEEEIQALRQQAIDLAIENQEYFLDIITSKYEKETEVLQENLEKRQSLYEKYFDDLEGKEDTDNYEVERQKLLNRIANLSTATDSTSLTKLKEAQQELQELTDEYNSSQRDARRDAVLNKFDKESEQLDKNLETTLADGNKLWNLMLAELEKSPDAIETMLQENGFFDGMTSLARGEFLKEFFNRVGSINNYNTATGSQSWTAESINAAIMSGLLSPSAVSTVEGDQTNNTTNNITINGLDLSNTNYSKAELEGLFKKSFEEFWNELLKQNGENQNLNPF